MKTAPRHGATILTDETLTLTPASLAALQHPFACKGPMMLEDFVKGLRAYHHLFGTSEVLEKQDVADTWFLQQMLLEKAEAIYTVIDAEYRQLLREREQSLTT